MQTYRHQMEFHRCQLPCYFSSSYNLPQLMYINNIIMALDSPNALMTWSRLAVEPKEFAIALKWSFHWFVILLSPDVPPAVSGRDSFLELRCFNFLPEIIAFSPLKFWKHWLGMKLILILSQKFHFMPEGSSCPTFHLCKWTTSGAPCNILEAHCLPVSRIQLLCSLIAPWHKYS